jgi:Domain of unknown function (DUF4365)
MPRKKHPRLHIIADLSVNHVERHIFLCGYSVERIRSDYGLDLMVYTYDKNGEYENGCIYVQLKATDSMKTLADNQTITFSISSSHLLHWLDETMPVIFIVYDAKIEQSYWIYIQSYFNKRNNFDVSKIGKTFTVHIPKANLLNTEAIQKFAEYKNKINRQIRGLTHHEE